MIMRSTALHDGRNLFATRLPAFPGRRIGAIPEVFLHATEAACRRGPRRAPGASPVAMSVAGRLIPARKPRGHEG